MRLATRDDLGGSHYNQHRDGSGIAHVSRLRPMLNARPGYRWWMTGAGGWSLGADMDLIDWLEAIGVHYDVDDLHEGGLALLKPYATSQGEHDELFRHVIEELQVDRPGQGGRECADARADLTYFATPEGGAVFSTGSINWVASLSHEGFANPVARITDNVLKRFLDPEPLPP